MQIQNHKEIYKGYRLFSGCLAVCVFVGVFYYFIYMRTSGVEVQRIVEKTGEYDKIYIRQVDLAGRIDTLYLYTTMFNTDKNDVPLQNSVSRRKQEIIASMEDMNGRDVKLFRLLMSRVNSFLSIKDSIRTAKIEEDLVRNDLMKCVENNKQTSRKVTLGGVTLKK
ncbi:MAG: type VI secretion system transmembrane protein TssO [Candidatus Azobacteroides sp.]|nr:type VI secretion system transmembrane protein TssO [Candidatus Azobacteroides sp.]